MVRIIYGSLVLVLAGLGIVIAVLGKEPSATPSSNAPAGKEAQACELGGKILQVRHILEQSDCSAEALTAITDLGHDSRYYVLTRGWLREELQGRQSQLSATMQAERRQELTAHIEFLQKAIRRLDLE